MPVNVFFEKIKIAREKHKSRTFLEFKGGGGKHFSQFEFVENAILNA